MISVKLEARELSDGLRRLTLATSNLRTALLSIGGVLVESSKQRFSDKAGPDNVAWAKNTASTINRKGRDQALTGETGVLSDTLRYELLSNDSLEVGSPMEYAAMQQFGGKKSEFPYLWGDIPARPFLGISTEDSDEILAVISDHLENALK